MVTGIVLATLLVMTPVQPGVAAPDPECTASTSSAGGAADATTGRVRTLRSGDDRTSAPRTRCRTDAPADTVAEPARSPGSAGTSTVLPGTGSTVDVANSEQLRQAIADAAPGDTIRLAAGSYSPVEIVDVSGTENAPITLTGPREAVIDGGGDSGYALHTQGADYWQLTGFTVTGGGKGIVVDDGQHNLLDSLDVGNTGEEAVHFRANSSDNTLQRSTIHDTGLTKPQFGEGAYIGSAKSNWKKLSGGQPDLSMRNRIIDNTFRAITAENVDVKEETAGALIHGNRFDGSATSGENYADSIVDVKGYDSTVTDNVTTGSSPELTNIIETHVITEPATSGCGNTITGNTVDGFEPTGALVAVDKKCGGDGGTGEQD